MVEKSDDRLLPTNKVRTIMKSCGDPSAFLSKESVLVVTKAAELFISYLTQQTHKKFAHKKDLNYNDLSDFVQAEERLEFLHQIVPKKITVKEFRDILELGSSDSESDSDASSDDENESDVDEDLVDDDEDNDEEEEEDETSGDGQDEDDDQSDIENVADED